MSHFVFPMESCHINCNTGKKSRPDPHKYPTGNVVGLGLAAAILTPGEGCDRLTPYCPEMLGRFHNESFHSVFHTRRILFVQMITFGDNPATNTMYKEFMKLRE